MFSDEYGHAAVEVLDVLDNTRLEDVKKIPTSFMEFLVNNADDEYLVDLDHSKPISELNISEKAKELLGYIYINWWCNKEEREEYDNQIKQLREKKQEDQRRLYNPDNIFKNRQEQQTNTTTSTTEMTDFEMIKYEENPFKRFINRILNLFRKKK